MAETNTKKNIEPKSVEAKKAEPKTAETKEEYIETYIPWVEGEDKEQVVGVNGTLYKIKKGVPVKVPKAVLGVLSNSNIQNMVAMENREKFKNQVTDI